MEGVVWDIRIVIDQFFGGVGIALFLFSIILSYYNKGLYHKLIRVSAYLAPIIAGIGLFALATELGKPFRMVLSFFLINPQSVTSWGGLIQGAFVTVACVYALLLYMNKDDGSLYNGVRIAGAFLAVAMGVYHGLLLTSLGRPLWADGSIVVLFLTASMAGGIACVLLLKVLLRETVVSQESSAESTELLKAYKEVAATTEKNKTFNFNGVLFTLIFVQMLAIISWFMAMNRGTRYQIESIQTMLAEYGIAFWIVAVIIGGLLPLAISLYQLATGANRTIPKGLATVIFAAVIVGSFALKFIILEAGQIEIPIQLL